MPHLQDDNVSDIHQCYEEAALELERVKASLKKIKVKKSIKHFRYWASMNEQEKFTLFIKVFSSTTAGRQEMCREKSNVLQNSL